MPTKAELEEMLDNANKDRKELIHAIRNVLEEGQEFYNPQDFKDAIMHFLPERLQRVVIPHVKVTVQAEFPAKRVPDSGEAKSWMMDVIYNDPPCVITSVDEVRVEVEVEADDG